METGLNGLSANLTAWNCERKLNLISGFVFMIDMILKYKWINALALIGWLLIFLQGFAWADEALTLECRITKHVIEGKETEITLGDNIFVFEEKNDGLDLKKMSGANCRSVPIKEEGVLVELRDDIREFHVTDATIRIVCGGYDQFAHEALNTITINRINGDFKSIVIPVKEEEEISSEQGWQFKPPDEESLKGWRGKVELSGKCRKRKKLF